MSILVVGDPQNNADCTRARMFQCGGTTHALRDWGLVHVQLYLALLQRDETSRVMMSQVCAGLDGDEISRSEGCVAYFLTA
jgi:hypothetical protein